MHRREEKQSKSNRNGGNKCYKRKASQFIISKQKNHRCFRNVKHLPCQYVAQKKSWMNSQIFEDWICKLDWKFRVDERKIAIIIDNCPAHPSIWQTFNLFSCPHTLLPFLSQWTKVSLEALKRITEGELCVCYAEPWRKMSLMQRFQLYKQWRYCWFLGGCNKGNCYQLFQEGWNQLWHSTGCHCWFKLPI